MLIRCLRHDCFCYAAPCRHAAAQRAISPPPPYAADTPHAIAPRCRCHALRCLPPPLPAMPGRTERFSPPPMLRIAERRRRDSPRRYAAFARLRPASFAMPWLCADIAPLSAIFSRFSPLRFSRDMFILLTPRHIFVFALSIAASFRHAAIDAASHFSCRRLIARHAIISPPLFSYAAAAGALRHARRRHAAAFDIAISPSCFCRHFTPLPLPPYAFAMPRACRY